MPINYSNKKELPFFKNRFPMNLQFFSEQDPPAEPPKDPQEPPKEDPPAEPKTFSEDYVKDLRDEAARYRTKAKQLETESQQKQQDLMKQVADMLGMDYNPDVELTKQLEVAKREAQEAKQNAHDLLIQANMEKVGANFIVGEGEEAAVYSLVDPELAFMVLDKENVAVKEKGKVEGMEEAMKKLFEVKPHLFSHVGSGNQQPQTPPKPNAFTPGAPHKVNTPKPSDPYTKGAEVAQKMFKKKEE